MSCRSRCRSAISVIGDRDRLTEAYRIAARALHPDAGGSTEDFQRLQEAKRVLDGANA